MSNFKEISPSVRWLNCRERFDRQARNPVLLSRFLSLVSNSRSLSIADLGCGTGNNMLFLCQEIPTDAIWFMVEQDAILLSEARRRIASLFSNIQSTNNVDYIKTGNKIVTVHFFNESIFEFLKRDFNVDWLVTSALLDLFTQKECQSLIHTVVKRNLSVYSTLNYSNVTFYPSDDNDHYFISLFENHMSRKLDKGRPLGKQAISFVQAYLTEFSGFSIDVNPSNWFIPIQEQEFIKMNFDFYRKGILSLAGSPDDVNSANRWLSRKNEQLALGHFLLVVGHQDLLLEVIP